MATLFLSKFEQIKAAVNVVIQGLDLPGIASENIVVGKVVRDRADLLPKLPGIFIGNYGNKAPIGGTQRRDDIPYHVLVAALQASNNDQTVNADRITYWLETIGSAFRERDLADVSTVYICHVKSDVNFDPALFAKQVDASVLILEFISRETRG